MGTIFWSEPRSAVEEARFKQEEEDAKNHVHVCKGTDVNNIYFLQKTMGVRGERFQKLFQSENCT